MRFAHAHRRLKPYLKPGSDSYEHLQVYMKCSTQPSNDPRFYKLDLEQSLASLLNGKTIVEFPTFYVRAPSQKDDVPLIENHMVIPAAVIAAAASDATNTTTTTTTTTTAAGATGQKTSQQSDPVSAATSTREVLPEEDMGLALGLGALNEEDEEEDESAADAASTAASTAAEVGREGKAADPASGPTVAGTRE